MTTLVRMIEGFYCPRCGHAWTPRVDLPKKCPSCYVHFDGIVSSGERLPDDVRLEIEASVERTPLEDDWESPY